MPKLEGVWVKLRRKRNGRSSPPATVGFIIEDTLEQRLAKKLELMIITSDSRTDFSDLPGAPACAFLLRALPPDVETSKYFSYSLYNKQ